MCVKQEDVEDDDHNDDRYKETLDEIFAFETGDDKIWWRNVEKDQRKFLVQRCNTKGSEHNVVLLVKEPTSDDVRGMRVVTLVDRKKHQEEEEADPPGTRDDTDGGKGEGGRDYQRFFVKLHSR